MAPAGREPGRFAVGGDVVKATVTALPSALVGATADDGPTYAVELRRVAELVLSPRNARVHSPGQIAQLVASITEFGWTNPVLVDVDGGIIAGHGRVVAAKALGMERVPCMTLPGTWSAAQRRAYMIADNKLALNAGWDMALLCAELRELDTGEIPITLTGFSDGELERLATWTPEHEADTHGFAVVVDCETREAQAEAMRQIAELGLACRAR